MINLSGGNKNNNANFQLWDNPGQLDSQFRLEPIDGGYYALKCVQSGKYLSKATGRANGTNVLQWDKANSVHSQWKLTPTSTPSVYTIGNRDAPKLFLNILGKENPNVQNMDCMFPKFPKESKKKETPSEKNKKIVSQTWKVASALSQMVPYGGPLMEGMRVMYEGNPDSLGKEDIMEALEETGTEVVQREVSWSTIQSSSHLAFSFYQEAWNFTHEGVKFRTRLVKAVFQAMDACSKIVAFRVPPRVQHTMVVLFAEMASIEILGQWFLVNNPNSHRHPQLTLTLTVTWP